MIFDLKAFISKLKQNEHNLHIETIQEKISQYTIGQHKITFRTFDNTKHLSIYKSLKEIEEKDISSIEVLIDKVDFEKVDYRTQHNANLFFNFDKSKKDKQEYLEEFLTDIEKYFLKLELETTLNSDTNKEKRLKI